MRAIEAFNETKHQQSDYGIFEDGWNAAIANTGSPNLPTLMEVKAHVVEKSNTGVPLQAYTVIDWVYDYICRQLRAGD